jgi:hypothetical protein
MAQGLEERWQRGPACWAWDVLLHQAAGGVGVWMLYSALLLWPACPGRQTVWRAFWMVQQLEDGRTLKS